MSVLEVAKLASVSSVTVSRVINNSPLVSAETARRVRNAMAQAGYEPPHPTRRPGPHPKSSQGIHVGQIALVPVAMTDRRLAQPFIMRTWSGVRNAAEERGLVLVLTPVQTLRSLPAILDRKRVDGVILLGAAFSEELRRAFRSFPAVNLYSVRLEQGHRQWCDRVGIDNEEVGRLAAKYLLDAGHRHLAFLNPAIDHPDFPIRGRAFEEYARGAGARVDTLLGTEALAARDVDDQRSDEDAQAVGDLVDRWQQMNPRPTALFIPRDGYAAVLYAEFYRRGLHPGKDALIIGCNNDECFLAGMYPRPATVDVHPEEIGYRAVQQLLSRLANPDLEAGAEMRVAPTLVLPPQR